MTKLSLLIYATDVLDSISNVCSSLGALAIVIFILFVIVNIMSWAALYSGYDDEFTQWCRAHAKRTLIIPVIAMLFFSCPAVLIPEKKTMYMIASVEMADMFRQTDTAKELSNEMKGVLTDITSIIHSYAQEIGANTQKEAK